MAQHNDWTIEASHRGVRRFNEPRKTCVFAWRNLVIQIGSSRWKSAETLEAAASTRPAFTRAPRVPLASALVEPRTGGQHDFRLGHGARPHGDDGRRGRRHVHRAPRPDATIDSLHHRLHAQGADLASIRERRVARRPREPPNGAPRVSSDVRERALTLARSPPSFPQ